MSAHKSITLSDTNMALLGDVILPAVAVGLNQSLKEADQKMVVEIVPLPENDPMSEITYEHYCQLCEMLDPNFHSQDEPSPFG